MRFFRFFFFVSLTSGSRRWRGWNRTKLNSCRRKIIASAFSQGPYWREQVLQLKGSQASFVSLTILTAHLLEELLWPWLPVQKSNNAAKEASHCSSSSVRARSLLYIIQLASWRASCTSHVAGCRLWCNGLIISAISIASFSSKFLRKFIHRNLRVTRGTDSY